MPVELHRGSGGLVGTPIGNAVLALETLTGAAPDTSMAIWGPDLDAHVRAWQRAHGLPERSVWGPAERAAAATVGRPPPSKERARGVDISQWQASVDFKALRTAGYAFAMCRTGDGLGRDTFFDRHWAGIKEAGLVRGAYHFWRAGTVSHSLAQADLVVSRVGRLGSGDVPIAIAVANGKTLRITCVVFSVRANAAAAAFGTLTLRENPSGTVLISSPTWCRVNVGNTEAVVGAARSEVITIPDGIEFSGNNQIGASLAAQATTNIVSVELIGFEY